MLAHSARSAISHVDGCCDLDGAAAAEDRTALGLGNGIHEGAHVLGELARVETGLADAKAKPAGAKGTYMKKVAISSTMGPGISIDVENATGN